MWPSSRRVGSFATHRETLFASWLLSSASKSMALQWVCFIERFYFFKVNATEIGTQVERLANNLLASHFSSVLLICYLHERIEPRDAVSTKINFVNYLPLLCNIFRQFHENFVTLLNILPID
jgi:hypothetical protein